MMVAQRRVSHLLLPVALIFVYVTTLRADDHFMPGYYCGVDQFTKTLSLMVSANCPRDRLNWCCMQHDQCYTAYGYNYYLLRQCDHQFGQCIYYSYIGDNPFCANWLYNTHAKAAELLGDAYKQQEIQRNLG